MFIVDRLLFGGKRIAIIAALGLLSLGVTQAASAHSGSPSNVAMQPAIISPNLTLNNPVQSGTPGTLLTFSATYTNPGAQPFMITGDIFNTSLSSVGNLRGLRPLGLTIPAGATITTPLFSVEIAPNAAPGNYFFTVFSDGFNLGGQLERSNTSPFTITVLPAAVPETATISLNLTVNTTGDAADIIPDGNCDTDPVTAGNQCTLRAALQETNNNLGNDTIGFDLSLSGSTITLLTALPAITDNVAINGLGANQLTVERLTTAPTRFRIFRINSGVTVSISNLTAAKGNEDGPSGGIIGGGILNENGMLTLTNVVVTGNRANSQGGGIYNTGTLTITNSTISNNSNIGNGGGIYNSGILTITNSTISNNIINGSGGAIDNDEGTVTIKNSTISNNSADDAAGGLLNRTSGKTFTVTNSTITGNRSNAIGGIGGFGGGINNLRGFFTLNNSIVAGNFRGTGTVPSDISSGTNSATNNITSAANNLIGDAATSGGIINGNNGNIVGNNGSGTININTVLDTFLTENGGPTKTHALVAGSPALDAGSNSIADSAGLTTDQRGPGFNRKVDGPDADTTATVDIGAFEVQVSLGTDSREWTTAGGSGATEDESNPARPTYANFTAAANAGSPAGTYVLRYNIHAISGLTGAGTNTRLRVRFRDDGAGSRVTVAIMRGPISGGVQTMAVFDSNAYPANIGFQTQQLLLPALAFDFTQNTYWLEVTMTKVDTANQPGFGSAQIKQQ